MVICGIKERTKRAPHRYGNKKKTTKLNMYIYQIGPHIIIPIS